MRGSNKWDPLSPLEYVGPLEPWKIILLSIVEDKNFNWRAFNQFHGANLALNSYVDQDTLTHFSNKLIVPLYI